VTNRRDQTVRVVLIVGIYGSPDAADPFWYNDRLALEAVTHSPSFNTHGPFIVDRETLLQDLTAVNNQVRWRVITNIDSITLEDLPSLIGNLGLLKDRLNDAGGPQLAPTSTNYDDFAVDGSLRSILLEADRSLTVTRSGVLMLSVQLSILAGLALVLTAGLLVDSRRIEPDLLRSRGATSDQILRMSLAEGAMLTLPAAAVAPWLAVGVLALLDRFGPLASIGLELDPSPTVSAFILSFLAALGCMAALAAPAYRSSRSFSESYVKRGRQESRSELQRAGVDLALLAAAAIGFWQLSVHSETITTSVRGRLGIDPLLVAGPAVGLVAGAVLALRLIPLLARLSDRMAGATKSTVPALSAWQISRRPARPGAICALGPDADHGRRHWCLCCDLLGDLDPVAGGSSGIRRGSRRASAAQSSPPPIDRRHPSAVGSSRNRNRRRRDAARSRLWSRVRLRSNKALRDARCGASRRCGPHS